MRADTIKTISGKGQRPAENSVWARPAAPARNHRANIVRRNPQTPIQQHYQEHISRPLGRKRCQARAQDMKELFPLARHDRGRRKRVSSAQARRQGQGPQRRPVVVPIVNLAPGY